MRDFPLPSYAAHIWIAGDEIKLVLPSPLDAPAHVLTLPNNERGMERALAILREREHESHSTLGKPSAPTQHQTDRALHNDARYNAWLREMRENSTERQREKAEAEQFLKDIGLEI